MRQHVARACAQWLQACLKLGWRKEDLEFLEALWWKYHDEDTGALSSPSAPKQEGQP